MSEEETRSDRLRNVVSVIAQADQFRATIDAVPLGELKDMDNMLSTAIEDAKEAYPEFGAPDGVTTLALPDMLLLFSSVAMRLYVAEREADTAHALECQIDGDCSCPRSK